MFELTPAKVTNVLIYGQATGAIGKTNISNTTGTLNVTWTVSDGGTPISANSFLDAQVNLLAGTYRLTVRDDHDTASINYVVTQNRPLHIYPGTVTDVLVFGLNSGVIGRTSVSGGDGVYTSYWTTSTSLDMSQDHSLQAKTNLYAGDYQVKIIDGVGATATYTYTVRQSNQLLIHGGQIRNASIGGTYGGSIAACKVTGGQPPYLSMLSSRLMTQAMAPIVLDAYDDYTVPELDDLPQDTYTLTISDSLGAVVQKQFIIREGPSRLYHAFGASSNFANNND